MANTTLRDRTGERYGRLVAVERGPDRGGRTTWRCRCDCGGERIVHSSSLTTGLTRSCGCLRVETLARNRRPIDADPTHDAMHKRIRRERGAAIEHDCVDCGEPAREWSYDGRDPEERTGPRTSYGRTYLLRFSLDPEHYAPRCAACHKRFDTNRGDA